MELAIAALITAFGGVIIALIQRGIKHANNAESAALTAVKEAVDRAAAAEVILKEIRSSTRTNGSDKELGILVEIIHADVRDTKNAMRRLERKVDRHHALPASIAHRVPVALEEEDE